MEKQPKFLKCDECNGTGIVEGYTNEGEYSVRFRDECIECDGNGKILNKDWDDDEDE